MFDGDWEDLFKLIKNMFFIGLKWLNVLVKTIIFWVFALLPAIIFITLACCMSSPFWFFVYSMIAIISEIIWTCLVIMNDTYR